MKPTRPSLTERLFGLSYQRGLFGGEEAVAGEESRWAPLFSAKTDEHPTDTATVECWRGIVRERFGLVLALDVAATAENAKAPKFYALLDNGLARDWMADADGGAAWMNPPYSDCLSWVSKALAESARGLVVVALLPARTDTAWFHAILKEQNRCEISFLRGRLRFGDAKGSAPFPSVVVLFKGERSSK